MKRTRIQNIELKNVTQEYHDDSEPLFQSVNLRIPLGQNISISGPPGTGKSILVKIIAGLVEPSQGDVIYNSQSLSQISFEEFIPLRMSTSVCFDGGGLLMNRTLRDNLILPLKYHDQWRAERSEKLFDDLISNFELKKFLDLRPSAVSVGIRKITGIVRSFLSNAQVLFLDEPTLGVGEAGVAALKHWIDLHERNKKPDESIVMSCSDDEFARTFGCHKYVLQNRRLVQTDKSKVA